jgi:hypothetical protein
MSEQQGQVVAVATELDSSDTGDLSVAHVAGRLVGLTVPDGASGFDEAVRDQLEALRLWWPEGEGQFRWLLSKNTDGTPLATREQVEAFLNSSGLRETGPEMPLVLFVSAHGLSSASSRHYLKLPTTLDSRLLATAVPTSHIVCAALDSLAQHVLVILNMCESSDVQSELNALQNDLDEDRKDNAVLNVLGTAPKGRQAMGKELARLLTRAHTLVTTSEQISRPYLSMADFTLLLHNAAKALEAERPQRRQARKPSARIAVPEMLLTRWQHEPSQALPNPGYRPEPAVTQPSLQDVAASYSELEHWMDKASGRLDRADGGWYFAGRRELNFDLVAFLRANRGVKVVTGSAGSGKSALLGRLVTLSDPVFRTSERYRQALGPHPDPVPEEGDITAAVSARHRTAHDVLQQLATDLRCPAPANSTDLSSWQTVLEDFLLSPGDPVAVVIDSLDEAYQPAHFITTVLAPFVRATRSQDPAAAGPPAATVPAQAGQTPATRRRKVRLLLGVRSPRRATSRTPSSPLGAPAGDLLEQITRLFPEASMLYTDTNPHQDICAYVHALLRGQPGWSDAACAEAASFLSERSHGSFLNARLAVEQLRAHEDGPRLLHSEAWHKNLAAGVAGLLHHDVQEYARTSHLSADEALALLRATAFALGRGVAWSTVWPALAEAVLQMPLRDPHEKIGSLLNSLLAGYLTSDHEDDRVVYRPAHEHLAQILRHWPADLKGTT